MTTITKALINKKIRHTGLTIVGNGDGYFYFIDDDGWEVGNSPVYVCYLKHLTLDEWRREAERAASEGRRDA